MSGQMTVERAETVRALYADVEGFEDFLHDHAVDLSTWYAMRPEDAGCAIPPEGAWIMVKRQPHTAIPSPPLYSMWRARPTYYSLPIRRAPRPLSRGVGTIHWPLLRAVITTPYGELTLLADEYVTVRKMPEWVGAIGDGVSVHVMGVGELGEAEFEERVFYLQSRGLKRVDALTLLLPDVMDGGFAFLSLDDGPDDALEYLAGAKIREQEELDAAN